MDEDLDKFGLWKKVRKYRTQQEIADFFKRDIRTIQRWEVKEDGPPDYAVHGLQQLLFSRQGTDRNGSDFTFIDLFAGIGGMRLAFEAQGGKCVFTSEYDRYAQKTYLANFRLDHPLAGDITQIPEQEVPDHDVLLAGFPCQPFSIAGVSKKNSLGRKHGFECTTQGTLFFDVARIIREKRPKAFLLENVKNLKGHNKGNTYQVIMETLRNDLGYEVTDKVIDAQGFVPQHRERIFIVGFAERSEFSWDALVLPKREAKRMRDILHPEDGSEEPEYPYTSGSRAKVSEKYILSDHLWRYLKRYAAKHKAAGNGFGYGRVTRSGIARTLSARYYKDGSEILIARGKGNPRRLTPRECSRLMGYDYGDRQLSIPVSDTRAYKQFGNGVVVPVVSEVARIMKPSIVSVTGNGSPAEKRKQIGLPL